MTDAASVYATYPPSYRLKEVQAIRAATMAGECVSVIGLSGSGKSNLMGFLNHHFCQQRQAGQVECVLVDCNRLARPSPETLFMLLHSLLAPGPAAKAEDPLAALESAVRDRLDSADGVCLLLDRFDALSSPSSNTAELGVIYSSLRALRDAHKYSLTYVTATRRPLDPNTELAELFFAHTIWLGPLSAQDARWSASRYAERHGLNWEAAVLDQLVSFSWGYPSFLRAFCEAYASGAALEFSALQAHPAVQRRLQEFLADQPDSEVLRHSGLEGHPLLSGQPEGVPADANQLTAKEHLLWEYLRQHPNQVCEKDELVRAVWPEDRIFEHGIRDDSLAQLVRRLREKIEPDPSTPRLILTAPGRGYRYHP